MVGTAKRLDGLGPKQSMRIRYDADDHKRNTYLTTESRSHGENQAGSSSAPSRSIMLHATFITIPPWTSDRLRQPTSRYTASNASRVARFLPARSVRSAAPLWGYHEFRPKQESIIRSLLAGHDACAVMPTGGGKSLCYQLPAVVSGKTAVVVSPLIALMQDQAASLARWAFPPQQSTAFKTHPSETGDAQRPQRRIPPPLFISRASRRRQHLRLARQRPRWILRR